MLIRNALKCRRPGVALRVHVGCEPHGHREWLFAVRDNGIGIAPEHANQILLPLKVLHGYDTPDAETGVAIAIGKSVVEGHGGRIWVEPEPCEGSTFCFTLRAEPSA